MIRTVCVLLLINVVFCVLEQKWRESEDGSKFYIETDKKYNWFEALSECARKNMSLIAIDSYDKHRQIDNLLRKLYDTNSPVVWIGGNNHAVQSRYEWVSTGQAFTFTNWAPHQPADTIRNEHCIVIFSDFQWHDGECYTHKNGFICEENQAIKYACDCDKGKLARTSNEFKNLVFYFNSHNN